MPKMLIAPELDQGRAMSSTPRKPTATPAALVMLMCSSLRNLQAQMTVNRFPGSGVAVGDCLFGHMDAERTDRVLVNARSVALLCSGRLGHVDHLHENRRK